MNSQSIRLFSPAKINLFLRIAGRRPDGFHELASLFQALSLGDYLTITIDPKSSSPDVLTCSDPQIPTDQTNLVLKAANLFRQRTGLEFSINVHLEKHIPNEAGLGGGSSNASTTLWALNQLLGQPATLEELSTWSADIGSDIPFFFSHGSAYCTGRGEHVRDVTIDQQAPLWIVKPTFGLSTKAVYDKYRQTASFAACRSNPENDLEHFLHGNPIYYNDLEASAFSLELRLAEVRNMLLDAGFDDVLMSGSGTAFFCIGESTPPASPDIRCFPAQFITRQNGEWYKTLPISDKVGASLKSFSEVQI